LSANFGETLERAREVFDSWERERERERVLSFALEMRLCCIKIIHAVPCQTETYTHKHNRKSKTGERERGKVRRVAVAGQWGSYKCQECAVLITNHYGVRQQKETLERNCKNKK